MQPLTKRQREILDYLQDFIPQDRETRRRVQEHLLESAFEGNVAIINVPLECDAFDKMALERRMLDASMKPFVSELKQ